MFRSLLSTCVVVLALAATVRAEGSAEAASVLPDGYRDAGKGVMENLEYTAVLGARVQVKGAIRSSQRTWLGHVYVRAEVLNAEGQVVAEKTFSAGLLDRTHYYYIKNATWSFPALACTVCHGTGTVRERIVIEGSCPGTATYFDTCPHCTGAGWECDTTGLTIRLTRVR